MTLFDVGFDSIQGGDLQTPAGLNYLMEVEGIGPTKAVKLAQQFGSLEGLRAATNDDLVKVIGKSSEILIQHLSLNISSLPIPDDVRVLCVFDQDWPPWLRGISSAPALIYVRGSLPNVSCLAIVGTRHPTDFGLRVVDLVVEASIERGGGIVSGLAIGIDSAGHRRALHYGIPTWAILGSGVDVPSPSSNLALAEQILESGGGLISEQPLGSKPNPPALVARNRLQVAASEIVVAAQCGIPSGTLHTVRFAIQQSKRLVVPRPNSRLQTEPRSAGNMALTDTNGCAPSILSATGLVAKLIVEKRPVADVVLTSKNLDEIWATNK